MSAGPYHISIAIIDIIDIEKLRTSKWSAEKDYLFFVLSSIISIVPKIKSKTVNIIVQYIQMCGKIKIESVYLQMAKHK